MIFFFIWIIKISQNARTKSDSAVGFTFESRTIFHSRWIWKANFNVFAEEFLVFWYFVTKCRNRSDRILKFGSSTLTRITGFHRSGTNVQLFNFANFSRFANIVSKKKERHFVENTIQLLWMWFRACITRTKAVVGTIHLIVHFIIFTEFDLVPGFFSPEDFWYNRKNIVIFVDKGKFFYVRNVGLRLSHILYGKISEVCVERCNGLLLDGTL